MTTRFEGNKFILDPRGDNSEVEISKGSNARIYVENLKAKSVYSSSSSANLGNNELSLLQTFQCSDTSVLRSQGTSVNISVNGTDKYIAVGSPYYIEGASQGGVGVLKATASTFSQQTTLIQTSFTVNAENGKYSTMNKDCNIIVFTDGGAVSSHYAMVYDRSGSSWTNTENIVNVYVPSISPSGTYLLGSSYNQVVKVYVRSGTFSLQQTIYDPSVSGNITIMKMMNDSNLIFSPTSSAILYHYTRSGTTWTLAKTITESSNIASLDYNDTTGNLCYLTTNKLIVYNLAAGVLNPIQEITLTATNVCINDSYIITGTSTVLSVYRKVFNVWTRSTNNTTGTGLGKLSATTGFLAVGCPTINTYGAVKTYSITTFSNGEVTLNTINLQDTLDLTMTTAYGTINMVGNVETTGDLYVSGNLSSGGNLDLTNIKIGSGTVSLPSLAFTGSLDTGIYSSGVGNFSVGTSGTNRLSINSTGISTFANTTDSSSISTGAVVLSGGLGVAKAIYGLSLYATTYNSANGGFKYAHYKNTSSQSIASGAERVVIFPTTVIDGFGANLTYSAGVFTVVVASKLYISYSVNYTGGSAAACFAHIETSGRTTWFGLNGDNGTAAPNRGLNGSAIISFTAGETFRIYCSSTITQNICGTDTYAASNCFIYSVP